MNNFCNCHDHKRVELVIHTSFSRMALTLTLIKTNWYYCSFLANSAYLYLVSFCCHFLFQLLLQLKCVKEISYITVRCVFLARLLSSRHSWSSCQKRRWRQKRGQISHKNAWKIVLWKRHNTYTYTSVHLYSCTAIIVNGHSQLLCGLCVEKRSHLRAFV